jgi:hypothetical protein
MVRYRYTAPEPGVGGTTGIEGDYDAKRMSFSEAKDRIVSSRSIRRAFGRNCAVCTSYL